MQAFWNRLTQGRPETEYQQRPELKDPHLIRSAPLFPDSSLPLLVEPAINPLSLVDWVASNRDTLKSLIIEHGGVLFRNFILEGPADFGKTLRLGFGDLLEYTYGSTPRSKVDDQIYTSTEYPPDQVIPLHNEMSYSAQWPKILGFYSVQVAEEGGMTPIADSRKVYQRIHPKIREQFESKQVMYVRNYGNGLDVPWQKVFQTEDKNKLKKFCDQSGIKIEWMSDNHLRTYQTCQATTTHPATREKVWFNQAHLFHVSNLPTKVRAQLTALFDVKDLPRNVYFGDGSPIEDGVLDEIRSVYDQEALYFPWQTGDVLILDNILAAHGRTTYSGPRKLLVAMAN